jgi:hypothetical protein
MRVDVDSLDCIGCVSRAFAAKLSFLPHAPLRCRPLVIVLPAQQASYFSLLLALRLSVPSFCHISTGTTHMMKKKKHR